MRVRSRFSVAVLSAILVLSVFIAPRAALAITEEEKAARAFKFASGLFEMEKFSEAASELEKFIRFYDRNKYSEYAMYLLGESYYKSGESKKALENYEEFLKKYPLSKLSAEVIYSAGYASIALSDDESALKYFGKLKDDPDRTIRLDSLFKIARILSDKKEFAGARKAFSDYLSALGNEKGRKDPSSQDRIAEALFLAGNLALRDRDFQSAQKYYSEFLGEFPDAPMAIAVNYNAGEMEYSAGRRREALLRYKSALEIWEKTEKNSENAKKYERYIAKIRYSMGWCYYSDKDFRQASTFFSGCFADAAFENRLDAGLRLGICKFNMKNFRESSEIFTQLKKNGNLNGKMSDETDYYLALSLQKGGLQSDALSKFEKLSDDTGEIGAESAYMTGVILFDQKKYEEASARFSSFIKKFPASARAPFASFNIGLAFFNLSRYPEAAKAFESFVANHPSSGLVPRAYFNLGEISLVKKEYAAAESWLSKIPEADPIWLEAQLKICDSLNARKNFDALGKKYDEIFMKFGSLSSGDSDTIVPLLFKMGKNLAASAKYDKASKVYEKIISVSKSARNVADARYRLATVCSASGDAEKAIKLFDGLLASAERGSSYSAYEVLCEKGKCLLNSGKPDGAVSAFDSVISASEAPEHVKFDARYSKGLALTEKKDFGAASEILENLAAEAQDIEFLARIHYRLARALASGGKLDEAVKNLLKIEILFRETPVADEARIYLLELYVKAGKKKDARNLKNEIMKSQAPKEIKDKARELFKN